MADDPEFSAQVFTPVNVKCNDSDCATGRHAFAPDRSKKGWQDNYAGQCRDCGAELVDWDRTKARDLRDVHGTFRELQQELIRHVFFHAEFDEKARAQALKLGRNELRARVRPHLQRKIGKAEIFRDGTQTPKGGSAIHFAQHATATCCRKCVEYWHGIPRGHELTVQELDYCTGLVLAYLDFRERDLFAPQPGEARDGELFRSSATPAGPKEGPTAAA